MSKQNKDNLIICIIVSGNNPIGDANIQFAKNSGFPVIILAPATNESARTLANKVNLDLILTDSDSVDDFIPTINQLNAEWLLCIKADELIQYKSPDTILSFIKKGNEQIYGIYTRQKTVKEDFNKYTFIRNLGQFNSLNEESGIIKIEPRLIAKKYLGEIVKPLQNNTNIMLSFSKIINGLQLIQNISDQYEQSAPEGKDHDLLCLKGEKAYGSNVLDKIDELNIGFNGFRVVNLGYLNGYMEIAERGWGSDNMYMSMLEYLNHNSNYEFSKKLYDLWIKNRSGKATAQINSMGGCIYGNLFFLKEAVDFYEKALNIFPDPAFFESLGKIHLILGNRSVAIDYLEAADKIIPNRFNEYILSLIKRENWKPVTLSVCIIARDEENTIAKTISSVRNVADEIIVIDTGSQDNTVTVADSLGARVISAPWNDDFSEVRNLAIDNAKCDYVMMLDADEFIKQGEVLGLALFKKMFPPELDAAYDIRIVDDESSDKLSVSIKTLLNQDRICIQKRIFPRRNDIRYSGFAFETIDESLIHSALHISATPLFNITEQRIGSEFRNSRKINAVRKSFADLNNSNRAIEGMIFYLKMGEWTEALKWLEKTNNVDSLLAANIVRLYTRQNRLEDAKKIAIKSLTDNPDSLDLNMALAKIYFQQESYASIYNTLLPFLNESNGKIPTTMREDFLYYLGISALARDHHNDAVEYIAQALENNPIDTRYQIAGLYVFAKSDNWEQFLGAAGQIVKQENMDIDFEINDFSDLGRLIFKLIQYFSRNNKNEETALLRKIIAHMVFAKFISSDQIDGMVHIISAQTNA